MTRTPHFGLIVVILGLLLTGCRTYGNEGYDSQRKTYEAIQSTLEQLEQDLGRAQSDLRQLESAATSTDTLDGLVDRYRTLVHSHEATLESYRADAQGLGVESSYRTLHRTYGAMVTDRRLLRRQYERTTRVVWATVRDTTLPVRPVRRQSTYATTPIGFPVEASGPPITMATALRGAVGTPGLQKEEAQPVE